VDDGRVNDAAARQQQALFGQVRLDRLKHRAGQATFLQQVPEIQDRGLVRDGIFAQFQAHKPAHRFHVVQGFFYAWI
jgi:hypothetical protein